MPFSFIFLTMKCECTYSMLERSPNGLDHFETCKQFLPPPYKILIILKLKLKLRLKHNRDSKIERKTTKKKPSKCGFFIEEDFPPVVVNSMFHTFSKVLPRPLLTGAVGPILRSADPLATLQDIAQDRPPAI